MWGHGCWCVCEWGQGGWVSECRECRRGWDVQHGDALDRSWMGCFYLLRLMHIDGQALYTPTCFTHASFCS